MLSGAQRSRSISIASSKPFNVAAEMLRLRYAPLSMTTLKQKRPLHVQRAFLFYSKPFSRSKSSRSLSEMESCSDLS